MNYHSDKWIMEKLKEHYDEALETFSEEQIVGIFLQGSQNYGLDIEGSDVDTKLIVVPSFKEIAMNKTPISTTHIRTNEEHIDFKDVRLYMQTFRKQNLNFLEILFTKYAIVNPLYGQYWNQLIENREAIARFNPYRGVQSMKGIALEKYHALEHPYPSKLAVLEKYGYDPKQLHHLARVDDYLERYIAGEPYESCLKPTDDKYLLDIKKGKYSKEEAEAKADKYKAHVEAMSAAFCESHGKDNDPEVDKLLDEVQFEIMRAAVTKELK